LNCGFGTPLNLQLAQDVRHVPAHRSPADSKFVGDRLVGSALSYEL
jgi:hypothetical protein